MTSTSNPSGRILVTGATGFIGFEIIVTALCKGYKVRGTVRREAQRLSLLQEPALEPYLDQVDFVIVNDIAQPDAFEHALTEVDFVIHLASPMGGTSDDHVREMINPAVLGTTGLLKSAMKFEAIKKVVITSSIAAILPFKYLLAPDPGRVFTEADVYEPPPPPYLGFWDAYCAAKAGAYQATDRFYKTENPAFDITSFITAFVIGKNQKATNLSTVLGDTNVCVLKPILGQTETHPLPGLTVHLHDIASMHLIAFEKNLPGHQSFLAASDSPNGIIFDDAIRITQSLFPERFQDGTFKSGSQPTVSIKINTSKAEKEFGKFKNFESQVESVVGHYVELVKAIEARKEKTR